MTLRRETVGIVFAAACGLHAVTMAQTPKVHRLEPSVKTVVFGAFDRTLPPALRISSGDIVELHTFIANGYPRLLAAGLPAGRLEPGLREIDDALRPAQAGPHFLSGPVFVEGAEPGDALQVDILEASLAIDYAFNGFRAGGGALPGEFPDAGQIIPLDRSRMIAKFAAGIEVPLAPFFGTIGVAPAGERVGSGAPGTFGGNVDNRDLVAGTTLFLPVQVTGALLSIGDGHAGQGNGEVDGAALETSLDGRFRVTVRKNMRLTMPRAETPAAYISMGLDPDLRQAVKIAVREMVGFLADAKGLTREQAYMLTSVAGDLVVTQVVDGTTGAHIRMPKSIFGK